MKLSGHGVTFTVMGCPVTACTLADLPPIAEPVLLDIDVDFLLTRKPTGLAPYFEQRAQEPWIWPSQFIERLRNAHLQTDLATIAYSVNGGFTPLRYKYFGDLIGEALAEPGRPVNDAPPPGSAAEAFDEASNALAAGNLEVARQRWEAMVRLDPSYRTVFAMPGWREEQYCRSRAALNVYDEMIKIDPTWHAPQVGRGRALWHARRHEEAETAFQKACALSAGPTSARYWLGLCQRRRHDPASAHRTWTRAVSEDPADARSWYALADLEAARGNHTTAIEHTRRALDLGFDGPAVHCFVARTLWRAGRRRAAHREFTIWLRQLLQAAVVVSRSWWRQVGHTGRRDARIQQRAGAAADAGVV